jgi:RNA polymerase-binding transcription factor DksA
MDQQTVDRLRERLVGERDELRRQLEEMGARRDADGIEDPELDEGFADAGQAAAERSNLLSLVQSLRDTLNDVEAALHRMDVGAYGICEGCRQPIGDERLEALPAARLCMRCKQQRRKGA